MHDTMKILIPHWPIKWTTPNIRKFSLFFLGIVKYVKLSKGHFGQTFLELFDTILLLFPLIFTKFGLDIYIIFFNYLLFYIFNMIKI